MTPLAWWDWLTLSPRELTERGARPEERYERTGHKRAMSARWVLSVGYWALESPRSIMARVGLDYQSTPDRASYDHFRWRWKVRTEKATKVGTQEMPELRWRAIPARCALAEDCYADVHHALRGEEPVYKVLAPPDAWVYAARRNGVLPIEAMLYYRGLLQVLEHHNTDVSTYLHTPHRNLLWDTARVKTWLPSAVRAQYASQNEVPDAP
jgi:hypothetical protein